MHHLVQRSHSLLYQPSAISPWLTLPPPPRSEAPAEEQANEAAPAVEPVADEGAEGAAEAVEKEPEEKVGSRAGWLGQIGWGQGICGMAWRGPASAV